MESNPPDLFDAAETEARAAAAAELDNLLEFRPREPQDEDKLDALARLPRDPNAAKCRHGRKRLVDADQRRVTCGECGDDLDPIWCLLNLIEYRESLRREREWIEAERRRSTKRQLDAVARRQRAREAAERIKVQENCRACGGTGFMPARSGPGVERC